MVKRPFNDWDDDALAKAGRLVAKFEAFSPTVYRCQAGVRTIGYGHTRGVVDGQTITKEDALRLLMSELSTLQKALASVIHVDVTEGQFVALLSLVYNIGVGNFRTSTLLRELNAGRIKHASEQFSHWIYVKKQPNKGLMKRREQERAVFDGEVKPCCH